MFYVLFQSFLYLSLSAKLDLVLIHRSLLLAPSLSQSKSLNLSKTEMRFAGKEDGCVRVPRTPAALQSQSQERHKALRLRSSHGYRREEDVYNFSPARLICRREEASSRVLLNRRSTQEQGD